MAARTLLLSGGAAFVTSLLVAGALFHEPGDGRRHVHMQPPMQARALTWELWKPPAEAAAPAMSPAPDLVAAPEPDQAASQIADQDEEPADVWAIEAEWSQEQ